MDFIHKPKPRTVRIGCYSAFWGDSPAAARQLVQHEGSSLNYLVADYLAEITVGILASRRKRRLATNYNKNNTPPPPQPKATDYIAEFIDLVLHPILPDLAKNRTKVVTNAGGLDPIQCKHAIEALLVKLNLHTTLTVAAVIGDDVLQHTNHINNPSSRPDYSRDPNNRRNSSKSSNRGHDHKDHPLTLPPAPVCLGSIPNLQPFSTISSTNHTLDADRMPAPEEPIVSLNAYLGARAIASALDAGADIVVTGRVVDSALVVGPLIHEYGWNDDQDPEYYDRLAMASLAGHIIECGCHATGGNFTDWRLAAQSAFGGYANMGYPIVEFDQTGTYFVVTKPLQTGGLVTPATVAEQILYEILDPALYLLPDVILDMRQVTVSQVRPDRVLVKGAKGSRPTPWLKCSGIFVDGWKISAELVVAGHEASQKALAVGQAIQQRSQALFKQLGLADFRDLNIEALGSEHLFGANKTTNPSREIILRLTAHHDNPKALEVFAMEISPAATCMAPGITGAAGSRPKSVPNLVHFPCLIPKTSIETSFVVGKKSTSTADTVAIQQSAAAVVVPWGAWDETQSFATPLVVPVIPEPSTISETMVKVKLIDVAYGRSGDKGDVCNIGIIARDPKYLPFIKRSVTEEVVVAFALSLLIAKARLMLSWFFLALT
ncbi:hypothetical protein F4703DRAFT_1795738 [Phycomyces blakesleeanus]